MSETEYEDDKRIDHLARKSRLVKGAGSTLATTIIVSAVYAKVFKEQMEPNLAVAVGTMIGSLGTGFVLCFKDFRALFCGYLIRKRIVRNRRRA